MEMEMEAKKIAVLFPGIGYTCDKPLLYYGGKLCRSLGYELCPVPYSGFPPKVKGDRAKMEESFRIALEQSREILRDVRWESYGEILFIGKSVGTIVAGAYAKESGLMTRNIYYTPLEDTFSFAGSESICMHGTADPWADTKEIIRLCGDKGIYLELFEGANHSLETGDLDTDLRYLSRAMDKTRAFLR